MDLLVLSVTLFISSPVKCFCTKKEKPYFDTQHNEGSGFPDDSHLISIRWISEVTNVCSFFTCVSQKLKMNTQVGCASEKVENNSGLIWSIWEKLIYFNYPRPEAANTEPDSCPRHS